MRAFLFYILLLVSVKSLALVNNVVDYKEGQQFANKGQQAATNTLSQTKASLVPGYKTDKPSESKYAENQLSTKAQKQAKQNEIAQFVTNSFNNRPQINIDKQKETFLQKANHIVTTAPQVAGDLNTACSENSTDCHARLEKSPDFNQAVSNLSAAADASKDFTNNFIFRGKRRDCRQDGFDYNDCCRDEGWGQDLHLAGCSDGEKALGEAKKSGIAHRIGSYCSEDILGVCLSHKQSYCTFNSKLARLIQEQGRRQLKMGWGSAESPNCRGFKPDELQRIDFSKINFADYYADIQKKQQLPNVANTQQRIKNRVTQFYNADKTS